MESLSTYQTMLPHLLEPQSWNIIKNCKNLQGRCRDQPAIFWNVQRRASGKAVSSLVVAGFYNMLNFLDYKIVDVRVRRTHKTVAWLFSLASDGGVTV